MWNLPRAGSVHSGRTALTASAVLFAVIASLTDWLQAGSNPEFDYYGLNAIVAMTVIATVVLLLIFRNRQASLAASQALVVLSFFLISSSLIPFIASGISVDPKAFDWIDPIALGIFFNWLPFIAVLVLGVWSVGCLRQIILAQGPVRFAAPKALGIFLVSYLALLVVPYSPVFKGEDFNIRTANVWEIASTYFAANSAKQDAIRHEYEATRATIEAAQPRMVEAALAQLEPRREGAVNVFVVGVGGWGYQQLFRRETRFGLAALAGRLPDATRSVALVNDRSDSSDAPIASIQNISQVLMDIGRRMDRDADLLILSLNSHGSRQGIALSLPGLVSRTLDPGTLKVLLDQAGIKNRILIVSACYSGVFVPVFKDPDAVIITAAAADRTSFGCSDDRDLTYFGEAFFSHGLSAQPTLTEAFEKARKTIATWESEGNLTPSEPQIHVGEAIRQRFPQIIGQASLELAQTKPGKEIANDQE